MHGSGGICQVWRNVVLEPGRVALPSRHCLPSMHCLPWAPVNSAEMPWLPPCRLGLASFLIALLLCSALAFSTSTDTPVFVLYPRFHQRLCSDYCMLLFPITHNKPSTTHINDRFSHTLRMVSAAGRDWLCGARVVVPHELLSWVSTQYEA